MNLGQNTGHGCDSTAPVVLHLPAGADLKAYCGPGLSQRPFWLNIIIQNRALAGVAPGLDLSEDNHGVPDAIGKHLVYKGFERIQLAAPGPGPLT